MTRGKNYIPGEIVSVLEKEEVSLFSFRCVSLGPRRSSLLFKITDETLSVLTAVTRTVLTHAGRRFACAEALASLIGLE